MLALLALSCPVRSGFALSCLILACVVVLLRRVYSGLDFPYPVLACPVCLPACMCMCVCVSAGGACLQVHPARYSLVQDSTVPDHIQPSRSFDQASVGQRAAVCRKGLPKANLSPTHDW